MNKLMITFFVWQLTAVDKIKARREAGQGTLEYIGMIAVAAIIITAVVAAVKAAGLQAWAAGIITSIKTAVGGTTGP